MVTSETIAALLSSPPPRRVPAAVARAARSTLTHWFLPLFGLIFLVIGVTAMVAFFPWRVFDDWALGSDRARPTTGMVLAVEDTNLTINDVKVVRYTFRYTPADNAPHTGTCHTTGRRWSESAEVPVRYLPAEPTLARIEGSRLSQGSGASAFVVVFPLVGGGLVGFVVLAYVRTRRVLQRGEVVEAKIVSIDETSTQINYKSVYRIVVRAAAFGGDGTVTTRRVAEREVKFALARARDGQPVYVLRHTRYPKHLLFPEAWIDRVGK